MTITDDTTDRPGSGSRTSVRPPVLRTAEHGASERRATWTELFFDLVFVVAVAGATKILVADQSLAGVAWFAGVFVAIAWSWSNFVMFTERFDTDDVVHRLAKALAMFAVAGVAFSAPGVREGTDVEFALAFLALRLVLLGLYVRAWRHVHDVRHATHVYLGGFGLGAACWAVSLAVPSGARPALWIAGGAVDLLTPLAGWRRFGQFASSEEHLEERSGQFTLVVLGQAVYAAVIALSDVEWDATVWASVVAAALVVVCLWWLTFDFVEVGVPRGMRGLAYVYAHLPVYGAVAALGVGFELVFTSVADPPLAGWTRLVLCGAGAVYLLGVAGVRASADPHPRALALHPLAAATLVAVGVGGRTLSGAVVLYVVAAVLGTELVHKTRLLAERETEEE